MNASNRLFLWLPLAVVFASACARGATEQRMMSSLSAPHPAFRIDSDAANRIVAAISHYCGQLEDELEPISEGHQGVCNVWLTAAGAGAMIQHTGNDTQSRVEYPKSL